MTSRLNPYIAFDNKARTVMEFYKTVFGGKLELSTFKEANPGYQEGDEDKIMHAVLVTESGMTIMASDMPKGKVVPNTANIALALGGDDEAELTGYWEKLSANAKILQHLNKAPWGDTFGMLVDQFGVEWMINIAGKK
ncbi:MAG: hypothetical protein JWO40_870 [Candidatus Doudnabacteria bacterium]|nr:hypothetical protein [Candidatus Doudnabacteria bacterium]